MFFTVNTAGCVSLKEEFNLGTFKSCTQNQEQMDLVSAVCLRSEL